MERAVFESINGESLQTMVINMHDQCAEDVEFDRHAKYPAELLRSEANQLPDSVDPKRKEIHLTHDDFVRIFEMKFMDFEALPNWRKQELKKRHRLF